MKGEDMIRHTSIGFQSISERATQSNPKSLTSLELELKNEHGCKESFFAGDWYGRVWEEGGFMKCPRILMREFGLELGSFFSFLVDWWLSHGFDLKTGDMLNDGWFYCTMETCEEWLQISPRTRRRLLRNLVKRGLIEVKRESLRKKKCPQFIRFRREEITQLVRVLQAKHYPKPSSR